MANEASVKVPTVLAHYKARMSDIEHELVLTSARVTDLTEENEKLRADLISAQQELLALSSPVEPPAQDTIDPMAAEQGKA